MSQSYDVVTIFYCIVGFLVVHVYFFSHAHIHRSAMFNILVIIALSAVLAGQVCVVQCYVQCFYNVSVDEVSYYQLVH